MLTLAVISLIAALVNGALGYGFSSIAVPLALLVVGNRALNPALVLLELVLNAYALWVNRRGLPAVWRRVMFVIVGLAPGAVLGTAALTTIDASWLKLLTYLAILPLILLQALGFRRAIRAERRAGAAFGLGVGALYAATTISGPPLAMFLTNQGYAKRDFRAALSLIRFAEATFAATLYTRAGLFTRESASLLVYVVPGVIVGVPLGALLIRHIREEAFRRVCMTFDAAVVAFGLSTLLRSRHVIDGGMAYLPFAAVVLFDAVILLRLSRTTSDTRATAASPVSPATPSPTTSTP